MCAREAVSRYITFFLGHFVSVDEDTWLGPVSLWLGQVSGQLGQVTPNLSVEEEAITRFSQINQWMRMLGYDLFPYG